MNNKSKVIYVYFLQCVKYCLQENGDAWMGIRARSPAGEVESSGTAVYITNEYILEQTNINPVHERPRSPEK